MSDARQNGSAGGQALFGICQGGADPELRRRSAERIAGIGFDGYGIGGLSVGESRAEMGPALAAATEVLPADRPRYLMGVGDPARDCRRDRGRRGHVRLCAAQPVSAAMAPHSRRRAASTSATP